MFYSIENFNDWSKKKCSLHFSTIRNPKFNVGEVWFCSIGLNIGYEEFGKGKDFLRPVLILKKYNKELFFGIPLTTNIKENQYNFPTNIGGKRGAALLSQSRTLSSSRLLYLASQITTDELNTIMQAFVDSLVYPPLLRKGVVANANSNKYYKNKKLPSQTIMLT